jgi:hypothetical protein
MEMVMRTRFTVIAAAMLGAATVAIAAEPAKAPGASAAQAPAHPSPVVLASADRVVGASAPAQANPAPIKRPRAARVTSCRCGDPQAQPDEQDQEQP